MPLAVPVLGVTNVDWTKHWTEAMVSLGIQMESEPFWGFVQSPDTRWKLVQEIMHHRGDFTRFEAYNPGAVCGLWDG